MLENHPLKVVFIKNTSGVLLFKGCFKLIEAKFQRRLNSTPVQIYLNGLETR